MAIPFFSNVDANLNELKNIVIDKLANDPLVANSEAGQIYYNTTDNELRWFNGTEWQVVGTGSGVGGAEIIVGTPNTSTSWNGTTVEPTLQAGKQILFVVPSTIDTSNINDDIMLLIDNTPASGSPTTTASYINSTSTEAVKGLFRQGTILYLMYDGTVWKTVGDNNIVVQSKDKSVRNVITLTASEYATLQTNNQLKENTLYNIIDDNNVMGQYKVLGIMNAPEPLNNWLYSNTTPTEQQIQDFWVSTESFLSMCATDGIILRVYSYLQNSHSVNTYYRVWYSHSTNKDEYIFGLIDKSDNTSQYVTITKNNNSFSLVRSKDGSHLINVGSTVDSDYDLSFLTGTGIVKQIVLPNGNKFSDSVNTGANDDTYPVNFVQNKNLWKDSYTPITVSHKAVCTYNSGIFSITRNLSDPTGEAFGGIYTTQLFDLPQGVYTASFDFLNNTQTNFSRVDVEGVYGTVDIINSTSNSITFSAIPSYNSGYSEMSIQIVFYVVEGDNSPNLQITNIQIEKGAQATPYQPYNDSKNNQLKVNKVKFSDTINVSGLQDDNYNINMLKSKNIFNYSVNDQTINNVKFTNADNKTILVTGTPSGTANITLGQIPATLNSRYYISGCPLGGSTTKYRLVARKIDSNGQAAGTFSETGDGINITAGSGVAYIRLEIYIYTGAGSNINLLFKPMITENFESSYNDYEPYTQNQIYVNKTKFTDTINVSNEQNTDYKVNLLKTKNLFDKNSVINGYRLTNEGTLYVDANYFVSSYIKVKSNTNYIINFIPAELKRICFYDSTKTFISYVSNTQAFTTPNETAYVRFTSIISTVDLQLEEDSTPSTYTPFITNEININNEKYSDTINVGVTEDNRSRVNVLKSHNLLNSLTKSGTTNDVQWSINGNKLILNGTASADSTIYLFGSWGNEVALEKLKAGTYNFNVSGATAYNKLALWLITRASGTTSYLAQLQKANEDGNIAFTLSNEKPITGLYITFTSGTAFSNNTFYLQVNEGNTPLSYEPYIVSSIKVDNEEIYRKPKEIWSGSVYTNNTDITLNEKLVVGGIYMIEFYALSGSYKGYEYFICHTLVDNGSLCQINYYSVPDNTGFRYRIKTTGVDNVIRTTLADNTASNTAISNIYRIA